MENEEKNDNVEKDIVGNYENNETQTEAKKYNAEKFSLTILIITILILMTIIFAIVRVTWGMINAGKFFVNEVKTQIRELDLEETKNL